MIGAQARAEAKIAPSVHPMIDYLNARHDGRVYAGDPNNWGNTFRVGYVPVYKYLANFDVDEVGFDLRTASLMSQPEANFDEGNPSDYPMFGIRYLLLPRGRRPFVPASLTMASGNYTLWTVERSGYLSIVQISGLEYQNRGTMGHSFPQFLP